MPGKEQRASMETDGEETNAGRLASCSSPGSNQRLDESMRPVAKERLR